MKKEQAKLKPVQQEEGEEGEEEADKPKAVGAEEENFEEAKFLE